MCLVELCEGEWHYDYIDRSGMVDISGQSRRVTLGYAVRWTDYFTCFGSLPKLIEFSFGTINSPELLMNPGVGKDFDARFELDHGLDNSNRYLVVLGSMIPPWNESQPAQRIADGHDMWNHCLGEVKEQTGLKGPRPLEDESILPRRNVPLMSLSRTSNSDIHNVSLCILQT